ncbi:MULTISPECIES: hypothetical protein [Mycolicibacter]|uniref:Transglycosylase SLT domain-containing protein n=2 Tax=Mycolicibacter TaxID=1073531 RepID=A0ABU5XL45_9MYCO|nr:MULTISPECIES: hypothetical protein [unclassified Mycolicibacter]MEB3023016.1 hypothetical protein [Mycolicibacter sp. MYC098]MEB3033526.1 hypothetical protein [Mycolicibacter sp. MYC340]
MTTIHPDERPALIRAGLIAAGVPAERVEIFAAVTDEIITTESGWDPEAVALALDSSFRGPAALFGPDPTRVMEDGRNYATPRGLAQLSLWVFEQYHATGTAAEIYDPVASIAALWRFIASHFDVDLATGSGIVEFRQKWYSHRSDWWWLTDLSAFSESPRIQGY